MAIANAYTQQPDGSLTALLRDGVQALTGAVNNSIARGRDMATLELNQENSLFSVLQNNQNLQLRKAEDLRKNFENDRLFGYTQARDTRQDFTTDRAFYEHVSEADRAAKMQEEHFNKTYGLTKERTDAAVAASKASEKRASTLLPLQEEKAKLDIANLQATRDLADELKASRDSLSIQAKSNSLYDILGDPTQTKSASKEALAGYVDMFGSLPEPEVQARVKSAERELATRQPEVDPITGKRIPDRFAPDKNDPFEGISDPQDQLFVAQDIAKEIKDLRTEIAGAKTERGKKTLQTRLSALQDKLRKAPVNVQKLAGESIAGDDASVESLFQKK